MELTNKSTTKAEQNSHMLLSIYHQIFRRLKHNIDELTSTLMAKKLQPYLIGITEQKLLLINDKSYRYSQIYHIYKIQVEVCVFM
jgi:hypothetical protein